MNSWSKMGLIKTLGAVVALGYSSLALSADVTWDRLLNAHKDPNNWMMYHQSFQGHHYSGLSQINTRNVKRMKVAWTHIPPAAKRGIQSFPLAVDGVLYYTSTSGQLFALDGATGALKWSYKAKIDTERSEGTFYNPYNRGIAIGHGNVYMGTTDGRMIAVNRETGKVTWENEIMSNSKGEKAFTGAPLIVKDMVLIGANGGELSGCCGPIFAVNAKTGETVWQFDTIGGDQRSRDSWGNDSWKVGGGGGWMTGQYDPEHNTVWWGTANPAPDYDFAGKDYMTKGPRPGLNLYSSSVVVLDADSGKLKAYFQEMPHDAWDFDSAVGEFMVIGGDMVHPNKGGIMFIYDRDPANATDQELKVTNAYMTGETFNYIGGVTKDGRLIDRVDFTEGMHKNMCPAIDGATSWNTGSYSPKTKLIYKVSQEWCFDLDVVKADRPADYSGQAYFGASWTATHPQLITNGPKKGTKIDKSYGTIQARDPASGKLKWRVEYKYPPLASLMSTKGNILIVPGADGVVDALDARNGKKLWSHNNGTGHHGGVISYMAGGKQYIAIASGWGSHVAGNYGPLFGEPFTSMSTDTGILTVYGL